MGTARLNDLESKLFYAILPVSRLYNGNAIPEDVVWFSFNYPSTRGVLDNLAQKFLNGKFSLESNQVLISTQSSRARFEYSDRFIEEYLPSGVPIQYKIKKPIPITDISVEIVGSEVKPEQLAQLALSDFVRKYYSNMNKGIPNKYIRQKLAA